MCVCNEDETIVIVVVIVAMNNIFIYIQYSNNKKARIEMFLSFSLYLTGWLVILIITIKNENQLMNDD